MILSGLVSVTFRSLSPQEIITLVTRAQIVGIEWGGDIHVPHGDVKRAEEVGRMTQEAGLHVAAYGSYFRVMDADGSSSDFTPILETALALGAPTIRVWAGTRSPSNADETYFQEIATRLRRMAVEAEHVGLRVALEFHRGTLTETTASALRLLEAVHHSNLDTLWQPPVDMTFAECVQSLEACRPYLSNLHVFHWSPGTTRQLLEQGVLPWRKYFSLAQRAPSRNRYALLEFTKDDAPENFFADAATLHEMLATYLK